MYALTDVAPNKPVSTHLSGRHWQVTFEEYRADENGISNQELTVQAVSDWVIGVLECKGLPDRGAIGVGIAKECVVVWQEQIPHLK